MTLNKHSQYALLLGLYISRAGRATIEEAAANMNLSKPMLHQVARKMRLGKVIKSIRGPGGGYELEKNVEVGEILGIFENLSFLTKEDIGMHRIGSQEQRALANYTKNLSRALIPLLNRKVNNVMSELVANEMTQLDLRNLSGSVN